MSRRLEEFFCSTECRKYFKTYLRDNMDGNFTIVCPSCSHEHYRVIKEGLVTEDRHNEKLGEAEKIIGLKSTISDTPYHEDPAFRRQQMRLYNCTTGGDNVK